MMAFYVYSGWLSVGGAIESDLQIDQLKFDYVCIDRSVVA